MQYSEVYGAVGWVDYHSEACNTCERSSVNGGTCLGPEPSRLTITDDMQVFCRRYTEMKPE